MQRKIRISLVFYGCILLGCFVVACATRSNEKYANGKVVYLDQQTDAQKQALRMNMGGALKTGLTDYRLTAGDVLEVIYHTSAAIESTDYVLGVDDEIQIDFVDHPEMNRTHFIRPDGKITLQRKGDVIAAGLRPEELADSIRLKFSDIFKDPEVSVSTKKYSSKISELLKALENLPRGRAKGITISPDGYIYLPLIDGVNVKGQTVDKAKNEINLAYKKIFNNLKVSLLLESVVGNRAFVFGEVSKPGMITIDRPMTVMQVISTVGGPLNTGALDKVKVLYWDESNAPRVRTVNLQAVLEELKLEEDMLVANNSVIFVPKTTIAKMDQWVDQYIAKLFLFNGTNLGVEFYRGNYTGPW